MKISVGSTNREKRRKNVDHDLYFSSFAKRSCVKQHTKIKCHKKHSKFMEAYMSMEFHWNCYSFDFPTHSVHNLSSSFSLCLPLFAKRLSTSNFPFCTSIRLQSARWKKAQPPNKVYDYLFGIILGGGRRRNTELQRSSCTVMIAFGMLGTSAISYKKMPEVKMQFSL